MKTQDYNSTMNTTQIAFSIKELQLALSLLRAQLAAKNEELAALQSQIRNAEFWKNWVYPEGATAEQVQNELSVITT